MRSKSAALAWVLASGCGFGVTIEPPFPPTNLEWGVSLYREGRLEAAAGVLEQATSDSPDDPLAWTYLGLVLLRLSEPERAMAPLDTAIAIDPKFAEARYARGLTYRRLGRIEEAISELEKAVSLNPTHAEAQRELDLAYLERAIRGATGSAAMPRAPRFRP